MSVREGQFTLTETLQLLGAKILSYDDVKVVLGIKDKPPTTWVDPRGYTFLGRSILVDCTEDLPKRKAAARDKAFSELMAKNVQATKEYQTEKTRIEGMK